MNDYRKDGVLKSIDRFLPNGKRRKKGPYVIIECVERIPCDPCVESCPQGAIKIDGSIVETPSVECEVCSGCLSCIPLCPGLAIFVVDETYSEEEGLVSIPYEFIPRPKKNDKVIALDRSGKEIGLATVHRVIDPPKYNKCAVVTLKLKKELVNHVRFFKREKDSL